LGSDLSAISGYSFVKFTGNFAYFTIHGLPAAPDGTILYLLTEGSSSNMTLAINSLTETTPTNRIRTHVVDLTNITTVSRGAVTLIYDVTAVNANGNGAWTVIHWEP
jgi:hypothetical protein